MLWQMCNNPLFNVTVPGPAKVEIFNGPIYSIDTTGRLQINGTVIGQPDPNITLCKVENGEEVVISNDHPRIMVDFIPTRLTIAIRDVRVNDNGMYQVKATNEFGGSSTEFTVVTQGENTTTCACSCLMFVFVVISDFFIIQFNSITVGLFLIVWFNDCV